MFSLLAVYIEIKKKEINLKKYISKELSGEIKDICNKASLLCYKNRTLQKQIKGRKVSIS